MRDCLQAASQFVRQLSQTPDSLIEKGSGKGSIPEPDASGPKQE
jgi:hypothetical protein